MNQKYAYISPEGKIEVLTEEQQEHYIKVVGYCKKNNLEDKLEETTHIDCTMTQAPSLTKFVEDGEFYYSKRLGGWLKNSVGYASDLYKKPNIILTGDFDNMHSVTLQNKGEPESSFPDFPFCVKDTKRNRKWLKENGCVWANGDSYPELPQTYDDTGKFYVRHKKVHVSTDMEGDYKHIDTHISVTGWDLSKSEKKRQETLDSISEKEYTINQLKEQMKELEKDVGKLKGSLKITDTLNNMKLSETK